MIIFFITSKLGVFGVKVSAPMELTNGNAMSHHIKRCLGKLLAKILNGMCNLLNLLVQVTGVMVFVLDVNKCTKSFKDFSFRPSYSSPFYFIGNFTCNAVILSKDSFPNLMS